jgi:hypothetical protein
LYLILHSRIPVTLTAFNMLITFESKQMKVGQTA